MSTLSKKQMKCFAEAKKCLVAGGTPKPTFKAICDHMKTHDQCCKTGGMKLADTSIGISPQSQLTAQYPSQPPSLLPMGVDSKLLGSLARASGGALLGRGLAGMSDRRPGPEVTAAQGEYDRRKAARRRKLYSLLGAVLGAFSPQIVRAGKGMYDQYRANSSSPNPGQDPSTPSTPSRPKQAAFTPPGSLYGPARPVGDWKKRKSQNMLYAPKRKPTASDKPKAPTMSGTSGSTVTAKMASLVKWANAQAAIANADNDMTWSQFLGPKAKTALRMAILGSSGAALGGIGGSILKKDDFEYGPDGEPRRKTRAGQGALLGALTGGGLGLLAHDNSYGR